MSMWFTILIIIEGMTLLGIISVLATRRTRFAFLAGFNTMAAVRDFMDRFKARYSSILCRELIGCDISTPEKSMAAMKSNAFVNCPGYVESAVTILEEMFRFEKT